MNTKNYFVTRCLELAKELAAEKATTLWCGYCKSWYNKISETEKQSKRTMTLPVMRS